MAENRTWFTDTLLARRTMIVLTAASVVGLVARRPGYVLASDGSLPVTGSANPELEPFDRLMTSFVEANKVPGASLAVTRNGRLMYARGFGYADIEKKEAVQPAALFRIASVSKPMTAVAILQLVEKGKLSLDDKVTERMQLKPFVAPGAELDPRWQQVTVRQCLQHTGGWDRDQSYDPMSKPRRIAKSLGIQSPVTPVDIVRYMMGQPLDFDPGERFAYSNLGYLVLGRILEAVTGQDYEQYVKKEVLGPLGITTAQLGRALVENKATDEVSYYDAKSRTGPCLYRPRFGQQVPIQYGADNLEAYEAHGGWIASAVDLVKFASAFDEPTQCPILGAHMIEEMWTCPEGAAGRDADGKPKAAFYGCGWNVRPIRKTGKSNTWHNGYITGSESLLVRRWDGLNWAVLFNTHNNPNGQSLAGLIDGRLHEAADAVKVWPETDQFDRYFR